MKLGADQFPLVNIGVNIYGKMWSSPLLVAATPQVAELAVGLLNEHNALLAQLVQNGPMACLSSPNGIQVARIG